MDTSLIDSLLATEMLEVVFSYLINKKDIRHCRNVCKLWRSAASSLLDNSISIKLDQDNCQKHLKYISQYPAFASRIKRLYFCLQNEEDKEPFNSYNRKIAIAECIISIANQCTNMTTLKLARCYQLSVYLKVPLDSSETKFVSIQHIKIKELTSSTEYVRLLHFRLNNRFQAIITHLEISDLGSNGRLKGDGDLHKFLSGLHQLKCLKLEARKRRYNIDFDLLLESCNGNLEELVIKDNCALGKITLFIRKTPNDWSNTAARQTLVYLELSTYQMSVNILEYIISKLKAFKKLLIKSSNKICDFDMSSFNTESDIKVLFGHLKTYCCSNLESCALSLGTLNDDLKLTIDGEEGNDIALQDARNNFHYDLSDDSSDSTEYYEDDFINEVSHDDDYRSDISFYNFRSDYDLDSDLDADFYN